MATLYELTAALAAFDFEIDEETGEILNADELDELEIERDEKVENLALWIKNLASDAEAYKREKDSFAKKEQAAKKKIESLKNYLTLNLSGEKFKTDRVTISWRKSETVEVTDPGKVPEGWFIPQEPKLDKAGLKSALKDGEQIPGVELKENNNIQIR